MPSSAPHPQAAPRAANRWLPVVGGVMMNMALGTFYANSAFLPSLEREFGWTRAQTSLVTTFGIAMIATWYVIGGRLNDTKGPRITAFIGGLLFSLGLLLASRIDSLPMLYLTVGICCGIGNGFGFVVPTAVGSKWFPDKRGLIVGLMVGGYGAGSGIFGPIAGSLIEAVGWRTTFRILAACCFVMTMVATSLLKNPPAGYRPPGWSPAPSAAAGGVDVAASAMLRTRTFWALWAAYCLGTPAGTMVISQLVPFARASGHTAAIAGLAITVGAVGNTAGRILSGWLSDHFGRLNTLRLMVLVSTVAMPLLFMMRENLTMFLVLLCVVYYCYGTQLSVYASTCADIWGTRNLGFNYGLLLLAWGVAGILGPVIGGRVYVATGEYRWAFYSAAAMSLASFVALFVAEPRRHAATPATTGGRD